MDVFAANGRQETQQCGAAKDREPQRIGPGGPICSCKCKQCAESRRIAQLPMIIPKGRSDRAWSKSAADGAPSSSAVSFSAFAAVSGDGSAETVGVSAGAGAFGLVSAVLVLRSTAVSGGGVAAPRTKFGAAEGAMLGGGARDSVYALGQIRLWRRDDCRAPIRFSSSEGSTAAVSAGRSGSGGQCRQFCLRLR